MREYHILHLEDSHSDADMIKRSLVKENLNFQYFLADDKESFIHGLTDFKPDVILKGEAISNETSYPQTDGKFIWYSIKGNPVLNQERNIAGVCITIDNITERKNAEEKLWESEAHLTEAQRLAKMGSWNFDLKDDRLTWSEELY